MYIRGQRVSLVIICNAEVNSFVHILISCCILSTTTLTELIDSEFNISCV